MAALRNYINRVSANYVAEGIHARPGAGCDYEDDYNRGQGQPEIDLFGALL